MREDGELVGGSAIPPDTVIRRSDGVVSQQAEGSMVLLSVRQGTYYALNEVGARVWELCDGTRSLAGISSVLADEYESPPDVIAGDIAELAAERLVVAEAAEPGQAAGGPGGDAP